MARVRALSVLLCVCPTACFNPPNTPLTGEPSTTEVDPTADPTGSSSSGQSTTTAIDPDTTVGPLDSSSTGTATGDTTSEPSPEIEVSIEGEVIEAGGSFELADTVAVGELGLAITVTVDNVGTEDLQIGGVLVSGPGAPHMIVDQDDLDATIAPGASSTFTVTFAPTNGGLKEAELSLASDDADENPYPLTVRGHTTENTYRPVMTMGTPVGRFNAALVDLQDGRLLLHGGRNAGGAWLDDTWIFELSTSTWTELDPLTRPPARNGHDMARVGPETVVMFGGTANMGGNVPLGDTWLFDVPTEQWITVTPPISPPARFQHGLVAIGNAQAVLTGGRVSSGNEFGDTWIFDATTQTWTDVMAAGAPTPLASFALAWDGADTLTRFGGFGGSAPSAQTWTYTLSTNTWTLADPMGVAGDRAVLGGEYFASGSMIVFSGKLGGCCIDPSPGTFAFDPVASTWSTITPPLEPSPRFNYAMVAVEGQNKAILFGGLLQNTGVATALTETWEYVGPRP